MSGYPPGQTPPGAEQFPPSFPQPTPVPPKRSPKYLYWVVGCLGALLLAGVVAIAVIGVVGYGVYSGVTNSEALKTAQEYIISRPETKEVFGTNIQFGAFPSNFNVSASNGKNTATVEFAVTGSKGSGSAHLEMVEEGTAWKVDSASLTGPTGEETPL